MQRSSFETHRPAHMQCLYKNAINFFLCVCVCLSLRVCVLLVQRSEYIFFDAFITWYFRAHAIWITCIGFVCASLLRRPFDAFKPFSLPKTFLFFFLHYILYLFRFKTVQISFSFIVIIPVCLFRADFFLFSIKLSSFCITMHENMCVQRRIPKQTTHTPRV